MSSLPPGLPEPITPRKKPLPPRGRDRQLSTAPALKPRAAPPTLLAAPARVPLLPASAPARRRSSLPIFVLLALIGSALAMAIPISAGIYYGNRERQNYLERQAVEHFQRALAYESETYTELAVAELQVALKFKSDYKPAQDKLRQLQAASAVHNQEPNDVAIAKQLFASAEAAVESGQWNNAIDLFEELRRVKTDYRAGEVKTFLIRSYINAGKQAIRAGQIDIAQLRFEAVLALDAANAEARALRERTILYYNGVQAAGTDWQTAVLNFEELYKRDPSFYDVKTQLREAHIGYGEFAEKQGAYCIVAREFGAAVELGADGDIQSRATSAGELCRQAVVAPTPTPTPLPEGIGYVAAMRSNGEIQCNGIGGITGIVQDADGVPLANVPLQVYNDFGYRPLPARSFTDGTYAILLGQDPAVFHLYVANEDGSAASGVIDVNYPGGTQGGCHVVVDWTKIN
jgi:tetratricopeptide (TPR) repeat protein